MSQEMTNVIQASADRSMIDRIEQVFRDHLFAALSEAREKSVGMNPRLREVLMDDLMKQFNPDGYASDLFSDGFSDARRLADQEVELREAELMHPRRVEAAE